MSLLDTVRFAGLRSLAAGRSGLAAVFTCASSKCCKAARRPKEVVKLKRPRAVPGF